MATSRTIVEAMPDAPPGLRRRKALQMAPYRELGQFDARAALSPGASDTPRAAPCSSATYRADTASRPRLAAGAKGIDGES